MLRRINERATLYGKQTWRNPASPGSSRGMAFVLFMAGNCATKKENGNETHIVEYPNPCYACGVDARRQSGQIAGADGHLRQERPASKLLLCAGRLLPGSRAGGLGHP